ncbi:MAG: SpoIIE family protein phosphatase [Candidatus Omnitrophota bacterium]
MSISPYSIPNFIVGALFILLGIFVFTKNPKGVPNRIFFFLACTSTLWQIMYGIAFNISDERTAYWLLKVGYIGVTFIAATICHYAFIVCKVEKKLRTYIKITYILGGVFALLIIATPLVIVSVTKYFWGYYPKAGLLHPLFLVYFIGQVNVVFTVYILVLIFKKKELSALQLTQMILLLIGYTIYTGACADFLPNYGFQIYPFGYLCAFTFISIIAFTIIRYKLMEIDTVIHRTILWLLTLVIVILPIGLAEMLSINWIYSLNALARLTLLSAVIMFSVWYYARIKPRIDHLFRRRKYDYYKVLGEIGQKIGSELNIEQVSTRLFKELKDVIYIRNGLLLVQEPGQSDYIEAGSIGYEQFVGTEKKPTVKLTQASPVSQWLQTRQKAIEKEQLDADPQYEDIKENASTFLKENALEILIPVFLEDKVNAIVGIGKKENLQAYTITDIELLENMGRQIGITIDNAMHHEDIVEKERLAEEMKLGREIQMNLLPHSTPNISGLSVQGLMQPAKEIGGDYYDFITLPNKDELSVVIGDVSGKGVGAGLLMAMAKTAIHTLSQEQTSPKEILMRTNSILNQHVGGQKFMTMLYFRWNALQKTLSYASAGHEHILIFRISDGKIETVQSGGFMLGMIPEIGKFLEDKSISLNLGDKVVLYTDGVTEARNPQEEMFGLSRLITSITKNSSQPAIELMNSVKNEVYSFIDTREQYDDITLVVMEAK